MDLGSESGQFPVIGTWRPIPLRNRSAIHHACLLPALDFVLPLCGGVPNPKVKETLALTTSRTRGILGALDILVDIGVFAEKEVIQ